VLLLDLAHVAEPSPPPPPLLTARRHRSRARPRPDDTQQAGHLGYRLGKGSSGGFATPDG
jgi:hypothetical protein